MTTLNRVKADLKIKTNGFDDELLELIEEAKADLELVGITRAQDEQDINIRAYIVKYVRAHFGQPEDYEQLIKWLQSRKTQLKNRTGYTDWGND